MSSVVKAIMGAFITALANCVMDHVIQVCLLELLGVGCPRHRSA